MKITVQDLLNTLEKNKKTECYIDMETIGRELGLGSILYAADSDKVPELKCYLHQNTSWLCTDEMVGLRFYFWVDDFICMSSQTGRKSDEYFFWKDSESFENLFNVLKNRFIVPATDQAEFIKMWADVTSWVQR